MIELVSYGAKHGAPPEADMHIQCAVLPDPSSAVLHTPGTDPKVGQVICQLNPLVDSWVHLLASFIWERAKEHARFRVAFECAAGWHRSVFVAEYVAALLGDAGADTTIIHRELEGFR